MKLSKLEKSWVLYDVGNSAFVLMLTTILPIFFKKVAGEAGVNDADSTALWGYAASAATILIAILGPTLGSLGDHKGNKKKFFLAFLVIGLICLAVLAAPLNYVAFLVMIILARAGLSGTFVFYDAMLPDVSSDEHVDQVSSYGYAFGYLGSCIPFVGCLGLVLMSDKIGLSGQGAMSLAILIIAVWWLACSIPLLRGYRQRYHVAASEHPVRESLGRLWATVRDIRGNAVVFTFLLAFFLYIDGVYTIIDMATVYGKDVHISDNDLLMALLLTQVVAFPFAILFGRLTKRFSTHRLILICIAGYFGIALFALQLDRAWEFWFLAVCVAVFQGAIQALSRGYFARIIPKEKSNEYFGLMDIFGKGAAFVGTTMMGVVTQLTGHSRYGVVGIAAMFVGGFLVYLWHRRKCAAMGVAAQQAAAD